MYAQAMGVVEHLIIVPGTTRYTRRTGIHLSIFKLPPPARRLPPLLAGGALPAAPRSGPPGLPHG